ncbi:MAG: peptidase [Cyclobacteriaceae bacterium]
MKKLSILVILLSLFFAVKAQKNLEQKYHLDFTQNLDTTYVEALIDGDLPKKSIIYQFAATAPGTYQTMNIGRFVSDFQAFDKRGRSLKVVKLSVNQYQIEDSKKLRKLTYKVAETFDTPVEEYSIYLMCGSSIEKDHVLINAHTLMGYFDGFQHAPIQVKPITQGDWTTGSALTKTDGYFLANDFDHLVDSPILSGKLTVADTTIANTKVDIYTYSQNDLINSKMLLSNMSDMLDAVNAFLVELPVENYTFLYFFEENIGEKGVTGAWEHSYSSEYILDEGEPTANYMSKVTDIASHEFFHIVTPLNIHSEIVEQFNFVTPTPSVHLWMYEGVTEWASNILLFRGGVVPLEDYLSNAIATKIYVDEKYFDTSWSLKKLSDESFNTDGSKQYGNIYYRGSLVAGLLDIKLLELSNGNSGLRELLLSLIEKYGKGNPVSEQNFFDDITAMTYPEIGVFFENYILDNQPLPHQEYLAKIGLELSRDEEGRPSVTKMKQISPKQKQLFDAWSKNMPLKP